MPVFALTATPVGEMPVPIVAATARHAGGVSPEPADAAADGAVMAAGARPATAELTKIRACREKLMTPPTRPAMVSGGVLLTLNATLKKDHRLTAGCQHR